MRDRGVDVALTIGPWTHDQIVTRATGSTVAETLGWLGSHLAGESPPGESPPGRTTPVRAHITGRDAWTDLPDWPVVGPEHALHLQPGGGLATAAPGGSRASTFRYDPADPTPTIGGRLLSRQGGYRDDTELSGRTDVLTFTSAPLETELTVYGNPIVEVDHSCDNPHFDVFVRVSQVNAVGRSRNVSDGFRRFSAESGAPIRLTLDPIAHRFSAGCRIRVLIAGGSHPRFARNLGTGEPDLTGRRMVASTHTVRYGAASRLILPVADRSVT